MKFREPIVDWGHYGKVNKIPNTGFANDWGYPTIEDNEKNVVDAERRLEEHKKALAQNKELKEKNLKRYLFITASRRNRKAQADPACQTCRGAGEVIVHRVNSTYFCPDCWTI